MKKIIKLTALLLIVSPFFIACETDDTDMTSPPKITEFTAGTHEQDNDTIVLTPNAEIIVDFVAKTQSDGMLHSYYIGINNSHVVSNPDDAFIILDKLFDENPVFQGIRNASIHKHVGIPEGADPGGYQVILHVYDEFENKATALESVFLIEE